MNHLKLLPALILIASATLLSAESPSRGTNQQVNRTVDYRHGEQRPKTPPPSFTILVQPAPVQVIQQAPVEQKEAIQKWYGRPTIADWGILTVTFFIQLGLLIATRRQAMLATQALIAIGMAERTWVAFDLDTIEGLDEVFAFRAKQEALSREIIVRTLTANYTLINCGKTPARVNAGGVLVTFVRNIDELPEEPNYTGINEIPLIMPPGRPKNGCTPLVLLRDHIKILLNEPKSAIAVYGTVRYGVLSDAADSPHESRFCFLAQFPAEGHGFMVKIGGPKSYNRYS